MSPTGERRDEARKIRTQQNPFGPQERQTRISKAKIQRVKTGGPSTLQRRNRQRKPQRRNRQRKPQRRNHQREVVNEINSSSEMRKTVKINGYDFDALIDTGSTITLIRECVYQILGRPTLNATKIKLTSFGKSEIKTFGSFKSTIDIEDNKFMTDIYVIDNLQTTIDVIIGTDVLKQTEFKITANGIELIPKKKDHFINLINVSKAHNQSELKDNALEVLQLKLKMQKINVKI
ncbi:uncharacterized protein TNCV_1062511 [Trichonephila clavipes]|nr:uncharacterized protein TNCV_1062511 [Trichonephila clavipes]